MYLFYYTVTEVSGSTEKPNSIPAVTEVINVHIMYRLNKSEEKYFIKKNAGMILMTLYYLMKCW